MKLTVDGREVEITPTPGDYVRFERQFGMGIAEAGDRFEHSMFLAWAGCKRRGEFTGDFDEFLDKIAVYQEVDDAPKA